MVIIIIIIINTDGFRGTSDVRPSRSSAYSLTLDDPSAINALASV